MRMSEMGTDRAAVRAIYPQAFAFQWTGYWRVYRDPEAMRGTSEDGVLAGPLRGTEADAWRSAAVNVSNLKSEEQENG